MSNSVRPHRWQPSRLCRPWDSPGKNTGVGCHFLLQCMKVKSESEVAQSCLTLSDPMDCSLPGSSIHGIFQARVLEWGAIAFSVFIPQNFSKLRLCARPCVSVSFLFVSCCCNRQPHQRFLSHLCILCIILYLRLISAVGWLQLWSKCHHSRTQGEGAASIKHKLFS